MASAGYLVHLVLLVVLFNVQNSDACANALDPKCPSTQATILSLVNAARRKIPATNMRKMTWSASVAAEAQAWANKCSSAHGGTKCGQNMGTGHKDWQQLFVAWESEKQHFTYGTTPCPDYRKFGHHTQNIWAKSHQIGCGYAYCPNLPLKKHFVCNYCSAGNIQGSICKPYVPGTPCTACGGKNSKNCDAGLCLV